jgi:hypothetical protein
MPDAERTEPDGTDEIPPYGTPPVSRFSADTYPTGADAFSVAYPTGPASGTSPGNATQAAVLASPPARRAPRPDPQRPSHALTSTVLGAALLAAAAVVVWNLVWGVSGPVGFVAAAVALTIVALGALVTGVFGRRAGALAPIGILLALVTIAGSAANGRLTWAGDHTWSPTEVTVQQATSYTLGVGNGRLDLRQVSAPGATSGQPAEVDARVGVGNLTVVVPTGVGVRILGSTGAGNIDNAGQLSTSPSGTPAPATGARHHGSVDVDLQTSPNPVILVRADVGVGNLTIDRANS